MSNDRRSVRSGRHVEKLARVPLATAAALPGPDVYLSALASVELEPLEEPMSNPTPSAPVASDGPLLQAVRELAPAAAASTELRWNTAMNMMTSLGEDPDMLRDLEEPFARMVRTEHATQPSTKREAEYLLRVLRATISKVPNVSSVHATGLLVTCERAGIRFTSAQEFATFASGLFSRLGPNRGRKAFSLSVTEEGGDAIAVVKEIGAHRACVPDQMIFSRPRAMLLLSSIDLFAQWGGLVPMCKCVRVAASPRMNGVGAFEQMRVAIDTPPANVDDLLRDP